MLSYSDDIKIPGTSQRLRFLFCREAVEAAFFGAAGSWPERGCVRGALRWPQGYSCPRICGSASIICRPSRSAPRRIARACSVGCVFVAHAPGSHEPAVRAACVAVRNAVDAIGHCHDRQAECENYSLRPCRCGRRALKMKLGCIECVFG